MRMNWLNKASANSDQANNAVDALLPDDDNTPMDDDIVLDHEDAVMPDDEEMMEAAHQLSAEARQPGGLDVDVLKLLISRLAQVLAKEADMLDAMNISGLSDLQEEKLALVEALEKQKTLLNRRSQLLDALTSEQRDELEELIGVFNTVMEENYKRLLVAKEVNAHVVQVVKDMANEQARQSFYTETGQRSGDPSVCFSLNQST